MAEIFYREATSADIPGMIMLLRELFAIEKDFIFDQHLQQLGLQQLLLSDSTIIFIAQAGEEIIGMVTGQLLVSTAEGSYSLVIEDLIIKKNFRANGAGTKLLKKIGSWGGAKGALRMQLLADCTNTRALEFYQKNNWQRTQLICLRKYNSGA